jgi:hypothetical protein
MSRLIGLKTHNLDQDQRNQLTRALSHFNDAQKTIRLVDQGHFDLPIVEQKVDVKQALTSIARSTPVIVVTGLNLSDNWFTHAHGGCGLMTLADWKVAFRDQGNNVPGAAPDANILTSLALVALLVLGRRGDFDVLHRELTGCLFDLCAHKPARIFKMRAAYVCDSCTAILATSGVSSVDVDAIMSVLDRVRHLVLGRRPQTNPPVAPDDEAFLNQATLPAGLSFPPRLLEACRNGPIVVLVGSGMSLQDDVTVTYSEPLRWKRLPSWNEVPLRLAESLNRYTGRTATPRIAETLDEFLIDLDFFKTSLGDTLYYPRAIYDIFTPPVSSVGIANRLLFRLPHKALLTTNYDLILPCAAPAGTPVFTWREARAARGFHAAGRPLILKIHGCASRTDTVVLTRLEYEELGRESDYLSLLRSLFEHQTILFVGFGLNDPRDLDHVLREARSAGAAEGEKFALLPASRCDEVRSKFPQIQAIPYNDHGEVASIIAALITATA